MKDTHLPLHKPNTNSLVLSLKIAFIVAAALTIFYQDLTIIITDALQSEITNYMQKTEEHPYGEQMP